MTKPARRIAAAAVLVASLSGASAQVRAADHALAVIDLRPREEKAGTGLTPLTGPCNEGVYIVADTASKPAKVAVLQSDLAGKLGVAGQGKTLTVLNWTIYYSRQMYGDQAGEGARILSSNGNPLSVNPYTGTRSQGSAPGSKCVRQESTSGWFERSEVHGKYSPLVSVFTGTFGGSPVSVRIVYSPTRELEGKFKGEVTDSLAVLGAAHQTADALAAILSK
jgi:hypothetical protein